MPASPMVTVVIPRLYNGEWTVTIGGARLVEGGIELTPACSVGAAVAIGLLLEPLAHPKPGGVTRCKPHHDKDILLYAKSLYPVLSACSAACRGECRGFMARGLREYRRLLPRITRSNLNLGSLMLLLPICRAVRESDSVVGALSTAAVLVASCDSREAAVEYYEALSDLGVSHLGRYTGPLPSVGSGHYPEGLTQILIHTRWDHVHRELLEGYPLTHKAFRIILERGLREESITLAVLRLLSEHGDTLIGRKYGWRAYLKAMEEARLALAYSERAGVAEAAAWLDALWRGRGWNPGSTLDIVAVAAGLAYGVEMGLLIEG